MVALAYATLLPSIDILQAHQAVEWDNLNNRENLIAMISYVKGHSPAFLNWARRNFTFFMSDQLDLTLGEWIRKTKPPYSWNCLWASVIFAQVARRTRKLLLPLRACGEQEGRRSKEWEKLQHAERALGADGGALTRKPRKRGTNCKCVKC